MSIFRDKRELLLWQWLPVSARKPTKGKFLPESVEFYRREPTPRWAFEESVFNLLTLSNFVLPRRMPLSWRHDIRFWTVACVQVSSFSQWQYTLHHLHQCQWEITYLLLVYWFTIGHVSTLTQWHCYCLIEVIGLISVRAVTVKFIHEFLVTVVEWVSDIKV